MKTLLILRHAKSSWGDARLSDHERPLNARGAQDAPTMGRLLRQEELAPDLILSSSARRAVDTAQLVAESCGYEDEIFVLRTLYHGAPEDFMEAVHEHGGEADVILVVGHNPGLEELVEELTGEDEIMPTAALAHVSLAINSWAQLDLDGAQGRLQNLWRPKEMA